MRGVRGSVSVALHRVTSKTGWLQGSSCDSSRLLWPVTGHAAGASRLSCSMAYIALIAETSPRPCNCMSCIAGVRSLPGRRHASSTAYRKGSIAPAIIHIYAATATLDASGHCNTASLICACRALNAEVQRSGGEVSLNRQVARSKLWTSAKGEL